MCDKNSPLGVEATYLNIKAMYDNSTANIILNGEKLKVFLQIQEQDKGVHPHHYYSTQIWKSQPQHSEKKKKIKGIQIGKKVKLSLLADDMILYKENPKDATRKLLQLIKKYSKVARYKINTQMPFAFLYTNDEKSEREIKEAIPFTIAMK